jgi:hypothetical protein
VAEGLDAATDAARVGLDQAYVVAGLLQQMTRREPGDAGPDDQNSPGAGGVRQLPVDQDAPVTLPQIGAVLVDQQQIPGQPETDPPPRFVVSLWCLHVRLDAQRQPLFSRSGT